jgi:hypothetical protein
VKLLKFPTKVDLELENMIARKIIMLEVIHTMTQMIEDGDITEFVASSVDGFGETQIHLCASDFISSVGLFEIGKNTLLYMGIDE